MKLLPEFQIESISAIEKKKTKKKNTLVSQSGFKPGEMGVLRHFGTRQQTILNYAT